MASGYREGAGVGTCDSACRPARRRSWSSSKMANARRGVVHVGRGVKAGALLAGALAAESRVAAADARLVPRVPPAELVPLPGAVLRAGQDGDVADHMLCDCTWEARSAPLSKRMVLGCSHQAFSRAPVSDTRCSKTPQDRVRVVSQHMWDSTDLASVENVPSQACQFP